MKSTKAIAKLGRIFRHASRAVLWVALGAIMLCADAFAQGNYEFTINQRRMGNQIGAEIWVRSLTSSAPNLGNATVSILYDNNFLKPAALAANSNPANTTDSIDFDVDIAMPLQTISSPYADNTYGYQALTGQAQSAWTGTDSVYVFQLDINLAAGSSTGFQPASTGRGTFVGLVKFDIVNYATLLDASTTGIKFNPNNFVGKIAIFDINGTDQTSNSTLTDPSNFTVRGITILGPNQPNQAVNRFPNPAYASLINNQGYPVYFERSGLGYTNGGTASNRYGSRKYAYQLDYSLDDGSSWNLIGRVAETDLGKTQIINSGKSTGYFASGDIDYLSSTLDNYITRGDSTAIPTPTGTGYGGILRVIWKADENFALRSERARLRITQLDTMTTEALRDTLITSRKNFGTDSVGRRDVNDFSFVLGRLFFVQLDGSSTYFRTANNYFNATQLTVEAWVNLNSINDQAGAEPGIVVASPGPGATSEEGAWMLYLKDGKYPAFRCLEIEGRGANGTKYLADLVSPDSLETGSDAVPITDAHAKNWRHIAATVSNNVATLYVDGEIVAQYTNNNAFNIRMATTVHPVWIGVNPNGGLQDMNYLHAGIKEVMVWRKALSQTELRHHIPGVYQPTNVALGDERTTLELYYPLQGARLDVANVFWEQNSSNPLNYYNNPSFTATAVNNSIYYRPDRSHIRLTAPVGREGVRNMKSNTFSIRWAAYGLGSIAPNSSDLQIMVSRDAGVTWFDAMDNQTPAMPLDTVEIEDGEVLWEPYNNVTTSGALDDLQGVVDIDNNYAKNVKLRISGTTARSQDNIQDTSSPFTVAPYFAFKFDSTTIARIPENTDLNLNGTFGYMEAWIRPYRFPTTDEGFFPILSKKADDGSDNLHYSLRLLPTGQLELAVGSTTGNTIRLAHSSARFDSVIAAPGKLDMDTVWTHVAVWVNLANGGNSNTVRFFIDGNLYEASATSADGLGTNVTVNSLNTYPTFIGYEPSAVVGTGTHFVGEIREARFWNGNPGNQSSVTQLEKFVSGAATIRADELGTFNGVNYAQNLIAAYTFNGGSYINNGVENTISAYPSNSDLNVKLTGDTYQFKATKPYMKLITPFYKQSVANDESSLFVRWIGFDYNRNDTLSFRTGNDAIDEADLEYSIWGGGNDQLTPWTYVASRVYNPSYTNALSLPTSDATYEFPGTTRKSQYGASLDVSLANPDQNGDGNYNDQGPIGATSQNGKLRLSGRSLINGSVLTYDNGDNGVVQSLRVESPLFTIVPPSNFTVRVLLEGYHFGLDSAITDIGTSYARSGLRITLYQNNTNKPGDSISTAESAKGYDKTDGTSLDPTLAPVRGIDGSHFASVPFTFTSIPDGRYFVKVEHLAYLPVLSRFAAPFYFTGDDKDSWDIESGWDFQTWTGTTSDFITESNASQNPPTFGTSFTAWGVNAETDKNEAGYGNTALVYNTGAYSSSGNDKLAAMVGGDVYKDDAWVINAADRTQVVLDNNSVDAYRSDVTGDGLVNNYDRDIVYRNNGKFSSLTDVPQVQGINVPTVPLAGNIHEINPKAPGISKMFIEAENDYYSLKEKGVKSNSKTNDKLLGGALTYKVTASPFMKDGYIDVPVYITNQGGDFALGNCTFGVEFDPTALQFDQMISDGVMFSNRNDLGYFPTFTSPMPETENPISNVRTIDVNYDRFSESVKPGQLVPHEATYLGTIRFKIVASKNIYRFSWHRITGVLTTDGRNVTGNGDFEPIQPIITNKPVSIIFPNGGEILNAGRPYFISWTKPTSEVPVYIDFTSDNGASWSRLTTNPVSLLSGGYTWATPRINSNECLIALVNAQTGTIIDKSDAPFTLMASPTEITRPATADAVYKSGTSDFIRWKTDVNVDVRFEFSADGLNGWTPVTSSVKSGLGEAKWILPAANTKTALVRMVNVNTGEIMAVSSPFKVLNGMVSLTSPKDGDKLKANVEKPIRWTYDNVNTFDMQYSLNGGSSWEPLASGVKALNKSYDWLVPNKNTDAAIVRAIYAGDPDLEYSRTGVFIITGGSDVQNPQLYGYALTAAVPNPFVSVVSFNFTIPSAQYVSVVVYNAAGAPVATLADQMHYEAGTYNLVLDGSDLPNGSYVVRMMAGGFSLTQHIVKMK